MSVSWVKGHSTRIDVLRGRTADEDKRGNDGADELARAGARLHQVSAELVAVAKERRYVAVSVQRMMISILKARFLAESSLNNDAEEADRGSDHEDCMNAVSDNVLAADTEDCMSNLIDDDLF